MAIRDINQLLNNVANSPALQQELRDDPVAALSNLAAPLDTDVWIYRMVVAALGLVVLVAAVGGIVLANTEKGVPDVLLSLGSAAIGALAGLLSPSPRG
jgi:hypothetical protein